MTLAVASIIPRRWPLVAALSALFLAGGAVGAWSVNLPYYAFSGGPVGDALAAVAVEDAEIYLPEGAMIMLTVSGQEVNFFEALAAGFDSDIDLVPAAAVRPPDQTDEEFVLRNRSLMDTSTQTAITLALQRLGYEITPVSDGIRVAELVDGTPAAAALQVDDVILRVDGQPVILVEDLAPIVTSRDIGETIALDVRRADAEVAVEVELVPRSDDPERAMIGISAETLNPRFEFPFPITIEAGQIGGPSAGMMYTLAVMDLLSPDDLTGGRVIAGTGTIDLAGNVGAIGGIRQKVVAAEAAGAEFMLVPAANFEEASTARRADMQLVSVATLDEALEFLGSLANV
ncbi:MAG TPA: PDZ domain-containing protein [Acidimicrobiia bacterium]|nr:PDZ domain-containing protein [Acidimicrobiia bacterium]